MNVQESHAMRQQVEVALTFIKALAAQIDRLEQRIAELETKRGPGRPPKTEQ